MLERLQRFVEQPRLGAGEALALLRPLFALGFGLQGALALLLGLLFALTGSGSASPLLGWTLLALSVLVLPLGAALGLVAGRMPERRSALAGAILLAVLLSVPVWFLAFGLAAGSAAPQLLALAFVALLAYALGFLLCAPLAQHAARIVLKPQAQTADESPGS